MMNRLRLRFGTQKNLRIRNIGEKRLVRSDCMEKLENIANELNTLNGSYCKLDMRIDTVKSCLFIDFSSGITYRLSIKNHSGDYALREFSPALSTQAFIRRILLTSNRWRIMDFILCQLAREESKALPLLEDQHITKLVGHSLQSIERLLTLHTFRVLGGNRRLTAKQLGITENELSRKLIGLAK